MKNDFDRIAKFYQRLSKLVFGDRLIQSQMLNLKHLKVKDRVLIVGGGDGEILNYLPNKLELQISYVELSSNMITIAKNRSIDVEVSFYNRDIRSFEGDHDVVIANFFLDCFNEQSLRMVLKKLRSFLSTDGKLLVTDFYKPKTSYDQFLLWFMLRFFRLITNLESDRLLPLHQIILKEGFRQHEFQIASKPRLFSAVYNLTD